MNFTQLRYFASVARLKNLSRASVELGIAQPAISRQIKLLESEVGAPLLFRHHRGVELTDVGVVLQQRAEFLIHSLEQTRSHVIDFTASPSGSLRLGCPPALTRRIMAQPLKQFMARYPKVRVELREEISDQLCREVLNDQLDLAVVSTKTSEPYLNFVPMFAEEIWLFGRATKTRKRAPISLQAVSRLPLLVGRRTNTVRKFVERRMSEAGLTPNIVLETDSVYLIEELATQGIGHAVAPYSGLADLLKKGTLGGAPIDSLTVTRGLVRRSDRPCGVAMRAFLSLLNVEAE